MTPINSAIDRMIADQQRRWSWLLRDAEQIKSEDQRRAKYGNVPGID